MLPNFSYWKCIYFFQRNLGGGIIFLYLFKYACNPSNHRGCICQGRAASEIHCIEHVHLDIKYKQTNLTRA